MRWLSLTPYVVLLVFGTGFAFSPTLFSSFRKLQTDPGDTVLNHYFLEHTWRLVSQSDYKVELWSPAFFYPQKNVLGYSDNLFGTAPIYWALRCCCSDVTSYQLWMILGFALNFISMAVVLRWFGLKHAFCALGAFVFAYATPHVQQMGHQQMCHRWWTPFAIWFAWRFLREPTGGKLFMCLLFIVGQFITGVYAGWFLAFGITFFGLATAMIDRTTRRNLIAFARFRPLSAILPFVCAALTIAPVVLSYMEANEGFTRKFSEVMYGMPHWNSWLSVPPGTLWYYIVEPINLDRGGEQFLFGGLVCLLLIVAGWTAAYRKNAASEESRLLIRGSFWAVVIMFVLSFSIWISESRGLTLWIAVYHGYPGAQAIRVAARIYLIVYPFILIGGLVGLHSLMQQWPMPSSREAIIAGGLIILAAAENYFPQADDKGRSFEHAEFYQRAKQFSQQFEGVDAVYVISDGKIPDYEHNLTMMWAGLYANVPVVNGYSGRVPANYPAWQKIPKREQIQDWMGYNWRGRIRIIRLGPSTRRIVLTFE